MRYIVRASSLPIHYYLLAGFIIIITAGCNPSKKIDRWIAERYGDSITIKKTRADYYVVSSPLVTADAKPSITVKDKTKTLFLLFYWKSDYSITSMLNPKLVINQFANTFTIYGNSKRLKEKLNGRSLELFIDKMPRRFSFRDDFRNIFLVFGSVHWDKIYMLPENADMVLRYTISGPEKKSGTITLPDNSKLQKTRMFEKLSTAYTEYLNDYEENIKTMAKSAVDKLLTEL